MDTKPFWKKPAVKMLGALSATLCAMALVLFPGKGAWGETTSAASSDVLTDIRNYTYSTWQTVKTISAAVATILTDVSGWVALPEHSPGDKSTALAEFFAQQTANALSLQDATSTQQTGLSRISLGSDVNENSVPYANDLTWQTLLGAPVFPNDNRQTDAALNYVVNAAGLNTPHVIPIMTSDWKGSDTDKKNYQNFYKTISSIQTFNAYVLGELYADYHSGGTASYSQAKLIQQASNSEWFATVMSEPIGLVLRQLLMYNSQNLAIMTQLLQTQKELLAAQAMANTLMIVGNQFNESLLLGKATGQMAAP